MADGSTARTKRNGARKTAAPTTPDPIEIAMEAEAGDAAPDSPARRVLLGQERLIGADLKLRGWEIADRRAAFGLKLLLALAALGAAAALGAMAWTASKADGLVVEAFSVPPDLARQGMTGTAVAAAVLDELGRLNRASNAAQSLSISDGWSAQSHVQIPQTGVSLDEVDRLLRRWLGHETHVTGEVSLTAAGMAISARASGGSTVSAAGPADGLPAIAAGLAEQLLAQARPIEYARVLNMRQQPEAAIRIYRALAAASESTAERAIAHRSLGGIYFTQGRLADAAAELREAIRLGAPEAHLVLTFVEHGQGHNQVAAEESALAVAEVQRRKVGSALQQTRDLAYARMHHALMVGDYRTAEKLVAPLLETRRRGGFDTSRRQDHMDALIGLHRTGDARREVPLMLRASRTVERGESFRTALMVKAAAADQDWPGVLETLATGSTNPSQALMDAPSGDAWRALALARMGRLPEAQALAATLPRDCYRCLRIRAEVAEAAGDRRAADGWFAEAIRQNPALPFADTDWARVRLARRDLDGAIKAAQAAHRKQRAMADPLEVWGEALLAKGDAKGAAAKFAEAAPFAPQWGRLHLKWGEALAKLGNADEAKVHWRNAAGLDLTPAERLTLAKVTGKRTF